MKLLNFTHKDYGNEELLGVVYNDYYALPIRKIFIEATGRDEAFLLDTYQFVQCQEKAMLEIERVLSSLPDEELQKQSIALDEVHFLSSIRPSSIRDCLGFRGHLVGCIDAYAEKVGGLLKLLNKLSHRLRGKPIKGVSDDLLTTPFHYFANVNSVAGHGASIEIPEDEDSMDFELEMGAVIARKGKNISQLEAHDHIGGYTIFNDFSARDIQLKYMNNDFSIGPGKGKSFDNGNVLGPFYVTADEVDDVYKLGMRAWVNGKQITNSNMDQMTMRFDVMINRLSQGETLYPGEVIGSGTTPGGCCFENGFSLQSGDTLEIEIDQLGRQKTVMA